MQKAWEILSGGRYRKMDGNDPGKLLDEMIKETQIRRAVLCIRNFHLLFQNGKMYQALGVVEKILMHLPQVILLADQTWPYSREEFPGAGHGTGDFASGYWGADHSVGGGAETAPGGNAGNISNRTCTARDPCRKNSHSTRARSCLPPLRRHGRYSGQENGQRRRICTAHAGIR